MLFHNLRYTFIIVIILITDKNVHNESSNETINNSDIRKKEKYSEMISNIKKREAPSQKKDLISKSNTKTSNEDLKLNALQPLNYIINNKANELNNLINIKSYLNNYLLTQEKQNITDFNINQNQKVPAFVIYKFENSKNETNLRRDGQNILPKLLKRIKANIKQLYTDIAIAQRLMKKQNENLPEELTKIMLVLRYYIRKAINSNKSLHSRRMHSVDTRKPIFNNSSILAKDSSKVLLRMIESYIMEKANDNIQLNITDALSNISNKWLMLSNYISKINNTIHNNLYIYKFIHLELRSDTVQISIIAKSDLTRIGNIIHLIDETIFNFKQLCDAWVNVTNVSPNFKNVSKFVATNTTFSTKQSFRLRIKNAINKIKNKLRPPKAINKNEVEFLRNKRTESLMMKWQKKFGLHQ